MKEQMILFDSHAHYTDAAFDADRESLLAGFPEKGIVRCMLAASDLESAQQGLALANQFSFLINAVGVHPECPLPPADYLEQLKVMASHPSVKAIGEIGLDYHYEGFDREAQQKMLCAQLDLARELDLPVILHCRDAMGDMLPILRSYRPRGVMHCFSGSPESAKEVLNLGLYIGFTGVLTFKNAKKPLAALQAVPLERLLIETDCPYMAPVPYRGKRCDSTMLMETAAVMAREKGVSLTEIGRITAENAALLFRCDLPLAE